MRLLLCFYHDSAVNIVLPVTNAIVSLVHWGKHLIRSKAFLSARGNRSAQRSSNR